MVNTNTLQRILEENNGNPFYIQYSQGKIKKPWKLYPTGEITRTRTYHTLDGDRWTEKETTYEPITGNENQRQVLQHELLIDLDIKDKTQAPEALDHIQTWLQKHKLSYDLYCSGGTGYHLHHFSTILKNKPDKRGITQMKKSILKKIQIYIDKNLPGNTCKVDLLKAGKKTLIQMEEMPHHRTMKPKTLLTSIKFDKEGDTFRKEQGQQHSNLSRERINNLTNSPCSLKTLPCLKLLQTTKLHDGHNRTLFVLTKHWLYQTRYNTQQVEELLWTWNVGQDKPFTLGDIQNTIRYNTERMDNRVPGCNYIHDLLQDIGLDEICNSCPNKIRIGQW